MSEGVQGERGEFRRQSPRAEGRRGGVGDRDDVVGAPFLSEAALGAELQSDSASVDASRLRTSPEEMRERLAAEKQGHAETKMREAGERKERVQKVVDRYHQEDEEKRVQIQEDARRYAARKEVQGQYDRQNLQAKSQEMLKDINTQLSDLLALQRTSKESLWSFFPGKRREIAKLEEAIGELRTRARIQRLQIADLAGEYHADSRKPRTWEIPDQSPESIEEELKAFSEDPSMRNRQKVQALFKEKVTLQAEREGWAMLVRPFRRHEIDMRLGEIDGEIKNLQNEVRRNVRAE